MEELTQANPELQHEVTHLRSVLVNHPIYRQLESLRDLRIYMENHVFAVWDFMSLVKRLQNDFTTVNVPWVPREHPEFARFINEIVLDEESDQDGEGHYTSHFALYLRAMRETGADDRPIRQFMDRIIKGMELKEAVSDLKLPQSTLSFVRNTLEVARDGASHEVAATFFYGREDIIPAMFRRMATDPKTAELSPAFLYYLKRHIELDGDQHGPLASRLLASLCGSDAELWNEALVAAKRSMEARIQLWDGILALLA